MEHWHLRVWTWLGFKCSHRSGLNCPTPENPSKVAYPSNFDGLVPPKGSEPTT